LLAGLALAEAGLQVLYRRENGAWRWNYRRSETSQFFQWHPYLVAVPRPGAIGKSGDKTVTINSLGLRGPEVTREVPAGVVRIATLGGSSTFGSQVSDSDAWPRLLEGGLGKGMQVVNFGVPGYSTVESLIQTALVLPELKPEVAIYYEGWNDLRSMHVRPLAPDYSDFHGPLQLTNLDILSTNTDTRLATVFYVKNWVMAQTIAQLNARPTAQSSPDKLTDRIDERAVALYGRNLRSIVALCRAQQIRPIFVPHLLNYEILKSAEPYYWVPYIRTRDLRTAMTAYNDEMRRVAAELSVDFVEPVLAMPFTAADFADEGHFNEQGSRKFAQALTDYVRSRVRRTN